MKLPNFEDVTELEPSKSPQLEPKPKNVPQEQHQITTESSFQDLKVLQGIYILILTKDRFVTELSLSTEVTFSPSSINEQPDLDLPIVIKKELENAPYILYLIFVSINRLFPSHKEFCTTLDFVNIPNIVHQALWNKKWAQAIKDEMNALE